jgi:O-glycosyl hydrolase
MALFITLGLISRPSAKMLSLAQHADYAQHLSVYAVSCTVMCIKIIYISVQSKSVGNVQNYEVLEGVYWTT